MIRDQFNVKMLSINEISANQTTIKNRTYPFVSEVYLIIRSDMDRSSMAYAIYEFMQTGAGKAIVDESGYVSN